jgi:hypothetical protein
VKVKSPREFVGGERMLAAIASPAPDAYAIFAHTRSAVSAAQYPFALEYTIAVSGNAGSSSQTEHYRAFYSPDDGKLLVNPVSSEEAAHPVTPHGANLHLTFKISINAGAGGQTATASTPAGNPETSPDLIGVPFLTPTYMFGLNYASLAKPAAVSSSSSLPTIAVVGVGRPAYSVALAGTAMIDGTQTYELNLTPLHDPKANRIRTLWVGVADYLPRKAIVAANFTIAPLDDVPWTIGFSVVDGVPLITDERPSQTLFLPHHHAISDVSIAFEDVHQAHDSALLEGELLRQAPSTTTLVEPVR